MTVCCRRAQDPARPFSLSSNLPVGQTFSLSSKPRVGAFLPPERIRISSVGKNAAIHLFETDRNVRPTNPNAAPGKLS
jgi:hypothetical protein